MNYLFLRKRSSIVRAPLLVCVLLLLQISIAWAQDEPEEPNFIGKYRESAMKRWDDDIRKLEELDQQEQHSPQAILFTGSSSIRRWETIAEDMQPWEPIRRGYGGARFSDLAIFVDRIVSPHEVQAIVIFVGNDISGGEKDKTPQEVLEIYKYIVGKINFLQPNKPIFCIGVTPTSSRWEAWPKVEEMNRLIQEFSAAQQDLHFIDTANAYLGPDGKPNDGLFVKDRLHLNAEGYKLWSRIIKKSLKSVLGPQ
ncbi:MAG: GDSL-type esterase/lipase family protein [Planctomycetota bacterium]